MSRLSRPLFRRGAGDSSLFSFLREESVVLLFSRERTLRLCFSQVDFHSFSRADIKLFLALNLMLFLAGRRLGSVSRGQLLRSLLQAVKVWPLTGPNPPKFHL